jgi:hypothetical protein
MSLASMLSRTQRRHRHARQPSVSTRLAQLGALLVILCAVLLLVIGARFVLAGLASFQAEAFISAWSKTTSEPSPRAWQIAQQAAQRAVSLSPVANGDYLDRLGRVYSWQYFRQPYAAPAAQSSRRAALHAYRAAVAARPMWPYSWARLAHSKVYLQEFDAEFDQAFARAFALGPWRIAINRELAEIGFQAWPHLTLAQRQATLESARRSVADGPSEAHNMRRIAEASGHLATLCKALTGQPQSGQQICP